MNDNEMNKKASGPTIVIFWLQDGKPMHQAFPGSDIGPSLAYAESLRKRRRDGEHITHVTTSTELVENVTLPGVSDKLPDGYDWTKRRGDPRRY